MDLLEIFLGFLFYTTIIYLWYSPLFWGPFIKKNEESYFNLNHKELYSKVNISAVLVTSFLTAFCFYKLIFYSAISPYIAAFLVWSGFFLPALIWLISLGKVDKREGLICGSGFLIALIGLASFYSIW